MGTADVVEQVPWRVVVCVRYRRSKSQIRVADDELIIVRGSYCDIVTSILFRSALVVTSSFDIDANPGAAKATSASIILRGPNSFALGNEPNPKPTIEKEILE